MSNEKKSDYSVKYPAYVAPKFVPVTPVVEPVVAQGKNFEQQPDKARDAAVVANVIRKNDPPKATAVHTFQKLAQDIADLTASGPGKVTQVHLDALHAKAQSILGSL